MRKIALALLGVGVFVGPGNAAKALAADWTLFPVNEKAADFRLESIDKQSFKMSATRKDAPGRGAEVVGEVKLVQVWTRPLADGGRAVALFNPSRVDKTVTVDFAAFGLPTRGRLRDVWRQTDLPPLKDGRLEATVFGHAANLYRIYPSDKQ